MPQQVSDIECSYDDLEGVLGGHAWFGGAWPALSDITIAATVSTLNVMVPIDSTRYLFSMIINNGQLDFVPTYKKMCKNFNLNPGFRNCLAGFTAFHRKVII